MILEFSRTSILGAGLAMALSSTAMAGGFSKNTGFGTFGGANSQTKIKIKSGYVNYRSSTYADARVRSLYGGKILEADAEAGNHTSYTVDGDSRYKQWKKAKAKVYAKGGNVMAKSRSENYVTIQVGGKAYIVTKEVARAMARFTPLGTTAAADSTVSVESTSTGYLHTVTGSSSKATVRVKN